MSKKTIISLLFFIPLFISLIITVGYPLIYTFCLSFFKKDVTTLIPSFYWLNNYIGVLTDETFYIVLQNTLVWTVLNLILTFSIGFLLALILKDENLKGIKIFRIILIIPWAISVPAYMSWKWLMNSDYGFFNELLVKLRLTNKYIPWLNDPNLVLLACIIGNVWHMFPYMSTMLLAGLQAVPPELYDSAEIDGATKLKKFIYITIPQIKPTIFVSTTLYLIWTMNSFVPYVFFPGGLGHRAETFPIYIYKLFFTSFNFGRGAAAATLLFLINLSLAMIYMKILKLEW